MIEIRNFVNLDSESYILGLEGLLKLSIEQISENALIEFDQLEHIGFRLTIYINDINVYSRETLLNERRRCIENFFIDMTRFGLRATNITEHSNG